MPSTVRLQRVLRSTPDRIYRAFLNPEAMSKWLPPNGFTGKVHEIDARVGGKYRMSFTNFTSGKSHSFGGEYLELVPNERIRHTDKFDDPNLPGEMVVTVLSRSVKSGTCSRTCFQLRMAQRNHSSIICFDASALEPA